jgi:hypothetical protein
MPKFGILPAGDNTSRPLACVFRLATASGSASRDAPCAPRAREKGPGPLVRRPSSVQADVTIAVGEVCWVSLIGKATDRFGELEGSNPFTQLQIVTPRATQNLCIRSAETRPLVPGCAYEAALTQIVKEELPDPHSEGLRMQ